MTASSRRHRSAGDDVDQLVGHDDDLGDGLAVEVGLDPPGVQRQPLELLARRAGGGGDAVTNLAVDHADQLERVGHEHGGIGRRPRLLPDPTAGDQLVDLGAEVRREREQQRGGRRGRRNGGLRGRPRDGGRAR